MAERVLEKHGFEIVEAEDGRQGLEAVQLHSPDCVVSDLLMPVMDGFEFLRKLRNSGSHLPVVIASADIQETSRDVCEKLGISGFLNKPIKADQLLECVQKALGKKREVTS